VQESQQLLDSANITLKIKLETEALESLKKQIADEDYLKQIEAMREQKRRLKEEIAKASTDIRTLSSEASLRARVELKRDALNRSQSHLDSMLVS